MRRLKHIVTHRRGAAAAEMALILPLALVLLFTMFEGSYYLICEHRVIKGVRDGARYAARLPLSDYACPAATFSGSEATVKNLTRTGLLAGGTSTVSGWVDGDITVSVACSGNAGGIYVANGGYAPLVTVSTQVVYPSLMGALGFSSNTLYIAASAQSPVVGV